MEDGLDRGNGTPRRVNDLRRVQNHDGSMQVQYICFRDGKFPMEQTAQELTFELINLSFYKKTSGKCPMQVLGMRIFGVFVGDDECSEEDTVEGPSPSFTRNNINRSEAGFGTADVDEGH